MNSLLGQQADFDKVLVPWLVCCGWSMYEINDPLFFCTRQIWKDAGKQRNNLFATFLTMSFTRYFVSLPII